jgi:hypothetical protein
MYRVLGGSPDGGGALAGIEPATHGLGIVPCPSGACRRIRESPWIQGLRCPVVRRVTSNPGSSAAFATQTLPKSASPDPADGPSIVVQQREETHPNPVVAGERTFTPSAARCLAARRTASVGVGGRAREQHDRTLRERAEVGQLGHSFEHGPFLTGEVRLFAIRRAEQARK